MIMQGINKAEIFRLSRKLTREEMRAHLETVTGKKISVKAFENIMRDVLPDEGYYQKEVMGFLRNKYPGAFVWKEAAGPYSRRGIPDVSMVMDGHFFGFEIKRPYIGRLTKIQELTIKQIREAGGTAAVVSFWNQAKEVIEGWKANTADR